MDFIRSEDMTSCPKLFSEPAMKLVVEKIVEEYRYRLP